MATRTEAEKARVRAQFFSEPKKCQCGCNQVVARSEGDYVPIGNNRQRWMRHVCAAKRRKAA